MKITEDIYVVDKPTLTEKTEHPKILFKYAHRDTALLILKSHSLRFSNPSDFNDVHDCDLDVLSFRMTERIHPDIRNDLNNIYRDYPKFREISTKKIIEDFYAHAQRKKYELANICCFTNNPTNHQMWGNYADKHRGVCLGFDSTYPEPFVDIKRNQFSDGWVSYVPFEPINYMESPKSLSYSKVFLCKDEEWEHESEYRFITYNRGDEYGCFKFVPNFLTSVIFGIKTSDSDIQAFIDHASEVSLHNLKYYKASNSGRSIVMKAILK